MRLNSVNFSGCRSFRSDYDQPLPPVTVAENQLAEEYTSKVVGIPLSILMENAGRGVAEQMKLLFRPKNIPESVEFWTVMGAGNNGGDGLVATRYLYLWGFPVQIFPMVNEERMSELSRQNYRIVRHLGITCNQFDKLGQLRPAKYTVIIDALLGTGLRGEVRPEYRRAISLLSRFRSRGVKIVAVDVPSGLDADRGIPLGVAVRADLTVSLGFPKIGLSTREAAKYSGQVVYVPLGLVLPQEKGSPQLTVRSP